VRFRSTLILLVVFAALGGYVYFAEYRGHDERQQQEASKKKLFPAPLKDVTSLSLAFPDHKISAVKKDDKHWEITEPMGIDADSDEWDMLVSSLGQIEKTAAVSASTDLAQYGLDKPVVAVTAKMKDGKTVGVLFGSENPKKSDNYAKLADSPDVFLSPVSSSKAFQKNLTDLRNKRVLEFAPDDINSIRIEDGKNVMEFQKSGMEWLIKKPLDLKADGEEISGFLSTIQSARATNFADNGMTLMSAGLSPVMTRITLHDAKANADRVLSIGKSPETDKYYARDESRSAIMIINKDVPAKARRPLIDWRDRSIAHVDQGGIDELEIVRGAEKISAKKQGSDWKLADGRKAQMDKISSLLLAVEFERAQEIIDTPGNLSSYGLDKPRIEVILRQGGKEVLDLKFGNATRNPVGSYLKVSTNPSVMTVAEDFFAKFSLKADDLAETH
jgi:hypothetical protein